MDHLVFKEESCSLEFSACSVTLPKAEFYFTFFHPLWLHPPAHNTFLKRSSVLTENEKGKMKYCRALETAKLACHPPHFSFALRCLSSYSLKASISVFFICPQDVRIHAFPAFKSNFVTSSQNTVCSLSQMFS